MTLSSLLLFLPVYALAVASPGPAVAAIIARTLGRGTQGSLAFIFGLIVGDLTWFAAATFGLSLIAQTYAPMFQAIKYAGAIYLLYVAWTIWRAPVTTAEPTEAGRGNAGLSAFLGAYFLTLGNPKTMVFFLSIMPLVISPTELTPANVLELALICSIVLSLIFIGYVVLASRARRMLHSSRAIKAINRTTAGMMAGTALVVATR